MVEKIEKNGTKKRLFKNRRPQKRDAQQGDPDGKRVDRTNVIR